MRSPPAMTGGGSGRGRSTSFRKWTRSSVCASSATSTKSMPLYDADCSSLVFRSFSITFPPWRITGTPAPPRPSGDDHLRQLLRLGLDQHILNLHDQLRLV